MCSRKNDKVFKNHLTGGEIMSPNLTLITRIAEWYNPIDVGLSIALGSRYIHSELRFDNSFSWTHNSFSSRGRVRNVEIKTRTKRRDKKGVHFAKVNYNKGCWLYTTIPVHRHQAELIHNRALGIVGRGYDSAGAVFGCGFDLPVDHRDKYWCSEAIVYALKKELSIPIDNLTPHQLLLTVQSYGMSKFRKI